MFAVRGLDTTHCDIVRYWCPASLRRAARALVEKGCEVRAGWTGVVYGRYGEWRAGARGVGETFTVGSLVDGARVTMSSLFKYGTNFNTNLLNFYKKH